MRISDMIAEYISLSLFEGGGVVELSRKAIADQFDCVPSQINYVIETRFAPQNGYMVQSRRGGGGFIRIVRTMGDAQNLLQSVAQELPDDLTKRKMISLTGALFQAGAINRREANLLMGACNDEALSLLEKKERNRLRRSIFRGALAGLIE